MIPLSQLLDEIRAHYSSLEVRYLHPSLYLICADANFSGLNEDQRAEAFLSNLSISAAHADAAFSACGVILQLVTPTQRADELGFLADAPAAHHWIEFLARSTEIRRPLGAPPHKILHFYGYKGGQARSTVLAMLSKVLADDGYRVLAVDADIEAPSLHRHYGATVIAAESTLLGCIHYGLAPIPQPVYLPKASSPGQVDILACKPADARFDLDLAIFALNTSLNPGLLQKGFERITALSSQYDVILVDHRSGLGSTVLPLAGTFPGSVLIFVRLDEQSEEAYSYFDVLLSQNPDMPGMFVSFSLDPEDSADRTLGRHGERVRSLLDLLAKAIETGAQPDGSDDPDRAVSGEDLAGYWLSWFHDRSFLARITPSVEQISADNRATLSKMRELVGLQSPRRLQGAQPNSRPSPPTGKRELTNSGNSDQGLLIQTEALRSLIIPFAPFTYVLGRKGTGKTRLARVLAERQLGIPLLVADDFPSPEVILSSDPILKDIAGLLPLAEAEKLWWILLDSVAGAEPSARHAALGQWLEKLKASSSQVVSVSDIVGRLREAPERRVFLIDGVETAFNSAQMTSFVEGLFRFLSSVQSDPQLSHKLTIRLFIRTDLVRRAVENVEQQIEGRSLRLSWDTQSILNFALSRICELEWFRTHFRPTTVKLESELTRLADGALSEPECNDFLLEIFPDKIRRNNLLTLTFLKDYFSEGQGETASFYPRIYDTFLRSIADPSIISGKAARIDQIEDGRVAQPLIIAAHDYASKEYLNQVAAELANLVQLSSNPKENQDRVESLIISFGGLQTPFEVESCVEAVNASLKPQFTIGRERVREALQLMKQVGIFEDRPGIPGWWRAGRLFKNALGMKYVR
ncbi:MAG: hypothetical protein JWN34_1478 [Bryobacterales bacterium]|nr:hypothetical protein [Bryobacterales bacterium]